MTPGAPQFSNDSESLQADVMRFMAIIAFCLIAILALVRNVEPTAASEMPLAAAQSEPIPEPEPILDPEPAPEPVPILEPEPESIPEPDLIPEPVLTPVATPTQPQPQPVVEPPPESMIAEPEPTEPPVEPIVPADEEQGLILRFASDGDFLRLIARGDIKVYAYQDSDVLGLNGSYRFLDTSAPGQVYELLTASIPSLIVDALKAERHDIQGFRWGISLPQRISTQIERYLGEVQQGQLVIDRFGDVHHVAAS